jgi:hypothetical protein
MTGRSVAAAALIAAGLGTALAIAPTYAQDAAETTTDVAQVDHRIVIHRGHGGHGPNPQDIMAFVARAEALMERFDTDGDGTVTQAEIDAARAAELAEYDADGDGNLTLEEYQAFWLDRVYERMVDSFQALDANGDGEITVEEFNAGLANIVARLDQNGDGGLNADDRPEVPLRQQFMPGPDGHGGPGGR